MSSKLHSKHVLFLEDDETLSYMMVPIFKAFVEEVFCAKTLQAARELMEMQNIDIIISDIHLKNENGLDFIKEVRTSNEDIPIIVLSAYKDEALLFKAIPLGLTAYLIKPVNYTQLTEAFEKCMVKMNRGSEQIVALGNGFEYDSLHKHLIKENEIYLLKKKELLFMELLSQNKNRLITKEMIENSVWESEEMSDAALYNFIMRIRNRFGKDFIFVISNLGYRVGY